MACVTGQMIRAPESQANVGYPKGTHHPAFVSGRDGPFEDWFCGWNHTTDLYRILEHVLVLLRMRHAKHSRISESEYEYKLRWCLERLSEVQVGLQPQFSQAFRRSQDSGRNRCGFQTVNIFGTLHLVKTIASVLQDSSFRNVLLAAQNMLEGTQFIPQEYYRAIGSPLLQKLAGVVLLLCNLAKQRNLSAEEMSALQPILLGTIDLLRIGHGDTDAAHPSVAKLTTFLAQVRNDARYMTCLNREIGATGEFIGSSTLHAPSMPTGSAAHFDGYSLETLPNMVSDICETLPDDIFTWHGA